MDEKCIKTGKISFIPLSMAFTAPVFMRQLHNSTMWKSAVPNFTLVSQKIWKIEAEIHWGDYGCQQANFHVTQTCSTTFYKQLLCWISWKSDKWFGWIVGHRQMESVENMDNNTNIYGIISTLSSASSIDTQITHKNRKPSLFHFHHVIRNDFL